MADEVLFFIDNMGGGGAERVVSLLSDRFAHDGYDVSIITLEEKDCAYELNPDVKLLFVPRISNYSFFYKVVSVLYRHYYRGIRSKVFQPMCRKLKIHLPLVEDTYLFYFIRFAWPCRDFLKKHLGATAFAFLPPSAITLAIAAKGLDVKTVFCERNYPLRDDMRADTRKLRDRCAKKYKYSVYQTESQKEYYASFIKGEKKVILNPIVKELPIPFIGERTKRIVNFCRLNHQKNLPLLISAFAEIQARYPEYRLEIYGQGPDEDEVFDALKKYRVTETAVIKPFSSTIHQDILDAAMFVSTSDFEGLSNSMLEAMAIGLPCICTDCDGGGARAVIRDGENGILVPKGNQEAIVKAMEKIILDPDYGKKLGENASRIRDKLSSDRISEEWKSMI